ncbi:DUF4129 domain-containing protein [Pullulanibacillus sp. KACC 23026]|uniref:DUF4129 domain-containing protein n=1 Tax=Pullulanibacillus sp. KACC 23026 TaxID=3028315 RepID=UPI0023B0422B|nr:DUF4129 domain-containing protein [Pullulanibacillus sp. KACC 23026]WEG11892.1 DUF4129 domain-containing protein [Pullulanibacillus sp. KACC 23026]
MESTKLSHLFGKWLDGLVEYLLVFPILLFIGVRFVTSPLLVMVSLPCVFVMGTLLGFWAPNKKRFVYMGSSLLISAVLAFFSSPHLLHQCILLLLNFICFYRGLYYGNLKEGNGPSRWAYWLIGFPIYFFAYFFFKYMPSLHSYLGVMTTAGVLMVMATLLAGNRELLTTSSLDKQARPVVPRAITSKNVILIIITLVVIGILAAFQTVKQAVLYVISGLIRGLFWVMSLFGSKETGQEPAKSSQTSLFLQPGHPSKLALLIDKLVHICFYIGLILVALWLIYYLSKNLGKWIKSGSRWLMKQLNALFHLQSLRKTEEIEYYDEKESLFSFKGWRESKKGQARQALRHLLRRETKWEDLENDEKIRHTYRQVVLHHIRTGLSFKPSQTPAETIQKVSQVSPLSEKELKTLSETYNKVRYGNSQPGEDELMTASKLLTNMNRTRTGK